MAFGYDANAAKRPVNMSLNEDLVAKARQFTGNLSEQVERMLAEFVVQEQKRRFEEEAALEDAIRHWNEYDAKHGSFADEYVDL
jgi:antitoxin CcdA